MSTRCRFILAQKADYGTARLCRVLGVARSSFYAWCAARPAAQARAAAENDLAAQIHQIHTESLTEQ